MNASRWCQLGGVPNISLHADKGTPEDQQMPCDWADEFLDTTVCSNSEARIVL